MGWGEDFIPGQPMQAVIVPLQPWSGLKGDMPAPRSSPEKTLRKRNM